MKTFYFAVASLFLVGGVRAQPANAISETWEKPAPVTKGLNAQCGPDGSGGDTATDHLKNRTDEPQSYHEVVFKAVTAFKPSTGLPTN